MADTTLDRISRDYNEDARRYVASLLAMGANRGQVVEKLRDRFGVTVSKRSVTSWRNNDAELIALVDELESIKRDLHPDDNRNPADLLPEPTDPAQASMDLFGLAVDVPAFGVLMYRADHDPDFDSDHVHRVLTAGHDDAAFAAACEVLIDGYDPHAAMGGEAAA
jgi:hypothetical protein